MGVLALEHDPETSLLLDRALVDVDHLPLRMEVLAETANVRNGWKDTDTGT